MSDGRRFGDQEIEAIFKAAAEKDIPLPDSGEAQGLTLPELQAIGTEVGFAPEQVADAVATLGARPSTVSRGRFLGMPISVGRSVDLPRIPTDREWEILVAELRATFEATGKIKEHGRLRQWTNGNLGVFVEPTESGSRLRLRTRKGDAAALNTLALGGVGMGVLMLVAGVLVGNPATELVAPTIFATSGAGAFLMNALRLPRWAQKREAQMTWLAARAAKLVGRGASEPHPDSLPPGNAP